MPERHGRLYFATGNYIGEFDLRDGTSDAVDNLGDVTIDHVSAFGNEDLLLTMRVYSNGREIATIYRYDIRTGELFTLFPGLMAEYLEGDRAVVYDDGSTLMATHRKQGYRDEALIDFHGYNSRPSVVVMSDHEILYSATSGDGVEIRRYDVITDTSVPLPGLSKTCSLNAAVWVGTRDSVYCRSYDEQGNLSAYRLVSLAGEPGEAAPLPPDKQLLALTYVADQDFIVLTERAASWGGGQPRNPVWIHHLDTGEVYILSKDQYLGPSVVYRP